MIPNEQKVALLSRAIEVQERAAWTTGKWVVFNEAQKYCSPWGSDHTSKYDSCGSAALLRGYLMECEPATMVEAVKSVCLEGAVLVAAYEQGISERNFDDFMLELGDIAGLAGTPNSWNDDPQYGAVKKKNVVAFLRHARDYFAGSDTARDALHKLTKRHLYRRYQTG